MRLDRLVAHNTAYSRSEATRLIRAKRLQVNGRAAAKAGQQVTAEDEILFDGKALIHREFVYLMLNKPEDVVCSTSDPLHETVIDLIGPELSFRKLQPAGRLDLDSTGLVLITDDGNWNHLVTAPGHKQKVYQVHTTEPVADADIEGFKEGLMLNGEARPTLSAELETMPGNECRVTVSEGRYHQVKRMFAACGNHVSALHRLSMGGIELDPTLEPGQWRYLTAEEVEMNCKESASDE